MSALCKTSVSIVYQEVINNVIEECRELFLEDGVDEQVLQELKETWKAKLLASKPVDSHPELENQQGLRKAGKIINEINGSPKLPPRMLKQAQVPPNNHMNTPLAQDIENRMVPIQIALPAQPGSEGAQQVLRLQVPATALQGNQLQRILTGPTITATMGLPLAIASTMLQQHVNEAFRLLRARAARSVANRAVIQNDGALDDSSSENELEVEFVLPEASCSTSQFGLVSQKLKTIKHRKRNVKMVKTDGARDTSDEDDASEDDEGSDEGDNDKEEDELEIEIEEAGPEDEPLNSEDDVTDEEPSDLFDSDNIVVCQYDKITKNRNKWRFHLKNGIMNLNGEDYVFQKANGDSEW